MEERKTAPDRYRAPALDKGLDILELLAEQPKGLTRAEIVRAMGRSPSEIYRMLERLVARHYVSRSAEGDRYELTMKLFVLSHRHPPVRRLVSKAMPLMDEFAREVEQSCHLVVPYNGAGLVVAQASPVDSWEFRVNVGSRLDLLTTGSGLTLLAFQDLQRREDTLAIWRGSDKLEKLRSVEPELLAVRHQGYRIADSQQLRGLVDITAPIREPNGDAVAVITCAFTERMDRAERISVTAILEQLLDLAQRLSIA
ncbi:IclR family transcriptional regulator [Ciceribacter sp. L1K23]|uniref:IclR family transcriptional regulator n=1 Tax=Ciceribacter sp. L1K23 TaxID=2820276 RepID=UPI001B827592|nr:IclR family transcriptional regulator [Ciceribacter sp. L1K23]MBR0554082.1 IclR family transcriptional regulator [Ciceribacter sp. L1K23]